MGLKEVKRKLLYNTVSNLAYMSGKTVAEWAVEHGTSYCCLQSLWCKECNPYPYTVQLVSEITGLSPEQVMSEELINEPTLRAQHRKPVRHPRLKAEVTRLAAEAGMNQTDFCRKKMGVPQPTLCDVWCGKNTRQRTWDRICRALGKEEGELFD